MLLEGLRQRPRGYAPRPAGDAPRPAGNTPRAAGGESRPAVLKRCETGKVRCRLFSLRLRGRLSESGRPVSHVSCDFVWSHTVEFYKEIELFLIHICGLV
jgi:hypothetical protein